MQETAKIEKKERVLITGNAGGFGLKLTEHLLNTGEYEVMSVDKRPLLKTFPNLKHFEVDLRRKSALELLRKLKPQSIIHLGVIRNPQRLRKRRENAYFFNLESTAQLISLAQSINLKKLIYLSTANLYGPSSNTTGLVKEDALLHAASNNAEFRDLVALDMMMQTCFWKLPDTKTIILRPCNIVGPTLNNAPSKYLRLDTIPTLLGYDPMMQLLHVEDLIQGIMRALKTDKRGIFNLAGVDAAPLSRIIAMLERPHVSLPEKLLRAVVATTFFYKKSSFPLAELDHLKYSCLIDDKRARSELFYEPKHSMFSILQELKSVYEMEKKNYGDKEK